MSLSNSGFLNNKDTKLNSTNKVISLNPNAAEFIPSAFRTPLGNTRGSDFTRSDVPGPAAKSVLDLSESNVSNKSDDEAQQYWRDQLPDDITPDFKNMEENELHTSGQLSLANLSLYGAAETSRFLTSGNRQLFGTEQDISPRDLGSLNFSEKVGYLGPTFVVDQSSSAFMTVAASEWDKRLISGRQQLRSGRDGYHYNGDPSAGLLNDSLSEHTVLEDAAISPVELLASQFPGFAADSLADVYYANGCDLNLTIEILTQLEVTRTTPINQSISTPKVALSPKRPSIVIVVRETLNRRQELLTLDSQGVGIAENLVDLQVDASFSQNTNSKSSAEAPSFSMLDFPALTAAESTSGMSKFNGEDTANTYRFPSNMSRGAIDFASTVRKLASQESAHRSYERSGSADGSVGSSRSSQLLNSSNNVSSKLTYGDKVRSSVAGQATVWLETGDAVANMYSDLREDARDFARLRNACFEQARQAYLIGNGSLARELSRKGQLYNMQMKAAHGKAKETIYRQRNPAALDARVQDRLIDLHGLHVNEAIQVLQHELTILRNTARSAGHRLQVMICVGTGHHTKGARTPARLPVAVEQFLLEEGLSFTQPQPGLLRVVIY